MHLDELKNTFSVRAQVWIYPGMAGWHFISLPQELSREIKSSFGSIAKGWGSLPVEIKIRETTWQTSIFPDKKTNTYLLPLKSAIRKKEHIQALDSVDCILTILRLNITISWVK